MKKAIIIFLALCSTVTINAQPPQGLANVGDTYGAVTNTQNVWSVAELNEKLIKKDTVASKITAKVLSSCPKKGCWMEVELVDKSKMFVKFKDYSFFVPTNIVGKSVVLDGIAFNKTVSVAELKHYAEDAKKSQVEIDAIKTPQKQTNFLADGVLVVK